MYKTIISLYLIIQPFLLNTPCSFVYVDYMLLDENMLKGPHFFTSLETTVHFGFLS